MGDLMTKYIKLDVAPAEVAKVDLLITEPDFAEEIASVKHKEPRGNKTAVNHLRAVAAAIGAKYDPTFNEFSIKPYDFEGRAYSSQKELSAIIVEMLKAQRPDIFHKYLEHKIKTRSSNTRHILYVGNFAGTKLFQLYGIPEFDPAEEAKKKKGPMVIDYSKQNKEQAKASE